MPQIDAGFNCERCGMDCTNDKPEGIIFSFLRAVATSAKEDYCWSAICSKLEGKETDHEPQETIPQDGNYLYGDIHLAKGRGSSRRVAQPGRHWRELEMK